MGDLPRGVRIDKGYVQVRIEHDGIRYMKNFGRDSKLGRELAIIHLAEKRKEFLLGKAGIAPELPSKPFREVAEIYYTLWSAEIDPNGRPRHTDASKYNARLWLDKLFIPFFGDMDFDKIRPIDVQRWRDARVKLVLGTSANREQATLGSLFSHIEMWVKSGKIKKPFKLPPENPSKFVEKAKTRKRERILTEYEARKLHLAFTGLADPDGWEICKLALQSVLSMADLRKLELGQTIDIERTKTGVPVDIPITVLVQLNWKNFRKRWEAARSEAGLSDVQFRDLRKTGINWIPAKQFGIKTVSQYAAHASVRTTEDAYILTQREELRPVAEYLKAKVDAL